MAWNIQTLDSVGNTGRYSDIDVDSNNYAHIIYIDSDNHHLKYIEWNGSSWEPIQTISVNARTSQVGIAIDTANLAHIAYIRHSDNILMYVKQTAPTTWVEEVIDAVHTNSINNVTIDTGYSNYPHVTFSYLNTGGSYGTRIIYAGRTSPVWTITDMSALMNKYGSGSPCMRIAQGSVPSFSFVWNSDVYRIQQGWIGWNAEELVLPAPYVQSTILRYGPNLRSQIISRIGSDIWLSKLTPSYTWENTKITIPFSVNSVRGFDVDSNNSAHILFEDGALRYVFYDGVSTTYESVDTSTNAGFLGHDIRVGFDDSLQVSYHEATTEALNYASFVLSPTVEWIPPYPIVYVPPTVGPPTTNVEIKVATNVNSTAYLIVLPDGTTAPTSQQVKDGINPDTLFPVLTGHNDTVSLTATAVNGDGTFYAFYLIPDTDYDIWVVAEDGIGLQANPTKLDHTTASIGGIYLSQKTNKHVVKNLNTSYVYNSSFGTFGEPQVDNTGLNFPSGITSDDTSIFVCDKNNQRIVKLDKSLNYENELDVSQEIGKPYTIFYDNVNSDLYVIGIFEGITISVARITTAFSISKWNTNIYPVDGIDKPICISRGFLSSDFIISGTRDLLKFSEMSTYFDLASPVVITGEENSKFFGHAKHSNGFLYLISRYKYRSKIIKVDSGLINVGDSNIISKTTFYISQGLSDSLLIFNADGKRIQRYDENLNFIEDVYVDSGNTVSTDCEEVYGIIELI